MLDSTNSNDNTRLAVLIVDDHPVFIEGISTVIRKNYPSAELARAPDAAAGLAIAAKMDLDLVLLDLTLPGMDGFAALAEFQRLFPALPVVVISAKERLDDVQRALRAGALGYLPKSLSTQEIVSAINCVLDGEIYVPGEKPDTMRRDARIDTDTSRASKSLELLSDRQLDVLKLLCHGKSNKQIAQELELSEKTIKSHVTTVFRVLGVVNRTQAVLAAKHAGLQASWRR